MMTFVRVMGFYLRARATSYVASHYGREAAAAAYNRRPILVDTTAAVAAAPPAPAPALAPALNRSH